MRFRDRPSRAHPWVVAIKSNYFCAVPTDFTSDFERSAIKTLTTIGCRRNVCSRTLNMGILSSNYPGHDVDIKTFFFSKEHKRQFRSSLSNSLTFSKFKVGLN